MSANAAARRPSFLFITTDQQRADALGCYGNPHLATPHIDGLAHGEGGVRLNRAYVANPLCMPARASLLTGRYPAAHRVWNNGVPLSEHEPTLAQSLASAGYRTALIGKAHFRPHHEAAGLASLESPALWRARDMSDWHGPYHGFQHVELTLSHHRAEGHYGHWLAEHYPKAREVIIQEQAQRPRAAVPDCWVSAVPAEAHNTRWIADRTIEQLRIHRDRDFFLWCSFPDPHHPFAPPAAYAELYDPADMPLPSRRAGELDERPSQYRQFHAHGRKFEGTLRGVVPAQVSDRDLRLIKAHYYATMTLIDEAVGRILAELDDLGLRDRTIVILTSDHGELLGDHGLLFKGPFMYEGLIRVPWIWSVPPSFGHPAEGRSPGRPVAGWVSDALVSQVDFAPTIMSYAGLDPQAAPWIQGRSLRALLEGRSPGHRESVVVDYHSVAEPGLVLKTLCTATWKLTMYADGRPGELTNLAQDPEEFRNFYGLPAHAPAQRELEHQLLVELIAQADCLPERLANA